jgi:stage III sporulation protein AD
VLLSVILWVVLSRQGKDYGLLLSLLVCSMVMLAAVTYLRELIAFMERLADIAKLQQGALKILLKVVGIGLVTQVVDMVCQDAGNQSLGKTLRFLSTSVILWIALHLLQEMLTMIETLLGGI